MLACLASLNYFLHVVGLHLVRLHGEQDLYTVKPDSHLVPNFVILVIYVPQIAIMVFRITDV